MASHNNAANVIVLPIGRKGVKKHWAVINRLLASGVTIKVVGKAA